MKYSVNNSEFIGFAGVEAMKVKAKEEKEAAKRKATPIIGDTMALMDALESVEQDLMQSEPVAPISTETQKKTKKKFSAKKRQREMYVFMFLTN